MPRKSKKRETPFNEAHEIPFGLKVCQRDVATKTVVSASCLFCVHFGREEKVGAKRRPTKNVHYFRRPFRTDLYRKHLETQHPLRWRMYSALTTPEKAKCFVENGPIVHRQTLRSHFSGPQVALNYYVNKNIVDVIVSEMLFHADDVNEGVSKERALAIFEDVIEPGESEQDSDLQTDRYRIQIKNPAQFHLVVDYVSVGASFRMASEILRMTRERTGLASIGRESEGKVASYVRFVCALNLQRLSELLSTSWTFSVAMDMSTHLSTSYLDVRVRLYCAGDIQNFHLLAIPMYSSHTGEQIFLCASKALDVVCPNWRNVIVSISTDGERKMTGKVQGVATRFERITKPGFFRLWCGLHQLDIALQRFFKGLMDGDFYDKLTGVISYLRRQQNLIKEMKTKAQKVADTRWESMSKVSLGYLLVWSRDIMINNSLSCCSVGCVVV